MRKKRSLLNVAVFAVGSIAVPAIVAGCGNGGASEPPVTSLDPAATSKLQFAVGVATMSFNRGQSVAYGLNTVLTLRQADGLSGTLYNVPQILGPTNFDILISTQTGGDIGQLAGADFGTNHITWATMNQPAWTGPSRGQHASTTGAFGYGFCPCNSSSGPVNGTSPLYQAYNLPIYGNQNTLFYGGPPAFPAADPAVLALGWQGYSLGFTDFAVQPVLGAYQLDAAVPPAYTTPQNPTPSPNPNGTPTPAPGVLSAIANLSHLTPLPAFKTPTFTPDGKGGGVAQVRVPNGATEAMVLVKSAAKTGTGSCLLAHTADAYYTMVAKHAGVANLVLPDEIGPQTSSGQPSATICPGGTYSVYAVGANYPAYEASYPQNLSQLPRIRGNNGQADVTTSDLLTAIYPGSKR